MPDAEFEEIVARLRADQRTRRRKRIMLVIGVAFCLAAVTLVMAGGIKGTVLAVLPWLAGMILVIRSRS